MKASIKICILVLIAGLAGIAIGVFLAGPLQNAGDEKQKEPLYWVAPMDPQYRRDEPGKSPMGMDLVPVYEQDNNKQQSKAGTVTISPDVVNNLGVVTRPVVYDTLKHEIRTVGYVQFDESHLKHIHPRVEGWIDQLHVKTTGEAVSKGQALYTLYSPQLVNAQEEYLLALKRNNSNLINAARERLRALQLSSGFIKRLAEDKQVRQTITFHAAQDGIVDDLNIREGFYVQPGTRIMSIGRLDVVWVEAEVFERQASLVHAGQHVTMHLDYLPDRSWQGEVDYVYPTLDPETRTVRVRLLFANPDRVLKPNMFAEVVIHAQSGEKMLLVPRQAVIRTERENRVVKALGNGRFRAVPVKTGMMNDNYIAVKSGLGEGDSIVTSAQFLIDSESSKQAAFQRMDHDASSDDGMNKEQAMDTGHDMEASHD